MQPSGETEPLVGSILHAVTTGAGFLGDGYDLHIIDAVLAILAVLYADQVLPYHKSFVVGMTYVGIILGQVAFGRYLDFIGHRLVSITTAVLSIVSCVAASCCCPNANFAIGYQLGMCRFVLGLGIGGKYLQSSTLCLNRNLAIIMSISFVIGMLLAPTVILCLGATGMSLDKMWRVGIVCGSIPSLITLINLLQKHNMAPTCNPNPESKQVNINRFAQTLRSQKWEILGVSLQWALQSMIFFGLGSYKSILNENMFGMNKLKGEAKIRSDSSFAFYSALITLTTSVGVYATIDFVARHHTAVMCFFGSAIFLWLCTVAWALNTSFWFLVLLFSGYTFTIQLTGMMCFLYAPVNLPPSIQATSCGITSVSAKGGALIGTVLFPIVENAFSVRVPILGAGIIAFLGGAVALKFVPQTQKAAQLVARHTYV